MSKKTVSVMNGKRFIAAYSAAPFAELESKGASSYPDYAFCDSKKDRGVLHWCLRRGRIEIPWGITFHEGECSANGSLFVSRLNVDETSFYGEGLPFVKESVDGVDVWYLYECEFTGNGFSGFAVYMRECLLPYLRRVAEKTGVEGFRAAVETTQESECELMRLCGFAAKLSEHRLKFEQVIVHDVRCKNIQTKTEE